MSVVLRLRPSFTGLWFCKEGLGREQWSCGGTGFGDTAQFWFNSKSVMLSEVACVVNYWSSSSSSDDCWDAFSSFSCDTGTKKKKFQLHPQGKCLSSGNNTAAAAACDSHLGGIYITGRTNVGKQNKQQKKKSKWKSLKTAAAWGRPRGGVSHLYWKVIHKHGESPWGILCLPFLGTLPAQDVHS